MQIFTVACLMSLSVFCCFFSANDHKPEIAAEEELTFLTSGSINGKNTLISKCHVPVPVVELNSAAFKILTGNCGKKVIGMQRFSCDYFTSYLLSYSKHHNNNLFRTLQNIHLTISVWRI